MGRCDMRAKLQTIQEGRSPEERDDRNVLELLQELRVAGLGVQVLFGFLLALPFSARFARLSVGQRDLHVAVSIR